jgi:hypothetical protein
MADELTDAQRLEQFDARFAKRIGTAQFEDVPVIRPDRPWRALPPLRHSPLGSAAGMCADHGNPYYTADTSHGRKGKP